MRPVGYALENGVFDKDKSQGSYGRNMPSLLNDSPFFDAGLKPPHYSLKKGGYGTSTTISISSSLKFVNDLILGLNQMKMNLKFKLKKEVLQRELLFYGRSSVIVIKHKPA